MIIILIFDPENAEILVFT